MRELPILFNGEMVRAILDGRKTQTRRPVKPQPFDKLSIDGEVLDLPCDEARRIDDACWQFSCSARDKQPHKNADRWAFGKYAKHRFGAPGDLLYVRETWALHRETFEGQGSGYTLQFRADSATRKVLFDGRVIPAGDPKDTPKPWPATAVNMGWRPSIHMPKWAARIWLEVTDVRVERIDSISMADVHAEGFEACEQFEGCFRQTWDAIYKPQGFGWDSNPWAWAVTFEVVDAR